MTEQRYEQTMSTALNLMTEPRGVGSSAVWFACGRVGARVADHGALEAIIYYGNQPMDSQAFYQVSERTAYVKLFTPYLLVESRAYQLELRDTQNYPGGYVSHLTLPAEAIEIEHALILLNDTLLYRVRVLRNPRNLPLRLRLALHEYTRATPAGRVWGEWQEDVASGALACRVTDPARTVDETAETWLGVVASTPLSTKLFISGRRYFETEVLADDMAIAGLLFAPSEADLVTRATHLQQDGAAEGTAKLAHWQARLHASPCISLGHPAAESFFRQAPLICESLMPDDLPGAMRAAIGHYWVWGWDTLVYCDSYLAAGNTAFVRDALELYRHCADPALGIAHQFTEQMTLSIPQALPAQGLYANMLYQYAAYTGDMAVVREYYPFARTIFQRTLAQARHADLFAGIALFPDFPQFAGQTGHNDLSTFNNAIFYQAARGMEYLAGMVGDMETAVSARAAWLALEPSFRTVLWDAEHGYWFDSAASDDLAPRRSYPAHAILWFTPFARELVADREAACADFIAHNHVVEGGLRMYPAWDPAFNGDGNQLAQHYPVGSDLLFLKMMTATGQQALLARWLGWLDAFWQQYTVPEGLTLEAENDGPHRPDCPGGKQPFCAKAWHMGIISALAGIEIDGGGLTIAPGLDTPLTLDNLIVKGQRYRVTTQGSGRYLHALSVNGTPVVGTCKAPADLCTGQTVTLEVTRGAHPLPCPQLLAADGATLCNVMSDPLGLRTRLTSPGAVRVWFRAPSMPVVTWQGETLPIHYETSTGLGRALLVPGASGLLSGELRVTCRA
ncbi:MAG TPA: hypothetical protein VGL77_07165 [Armatimonadota bacterium]|jgi:hypothetical protein